MSSVTVAGAHGTVVTLSYDSAANAQLAQQLAGAITAGVKAGTIIPADSKNGPPPPVPGGKTGEFVQSTGGVTHLTHGYDDVVITSPNATVYGSGDPNEVVLGDMTFIATGGSGTVVAGGGKDLISISGSGNWLIDTGNGNDTIRATGGGNDTISVGTGKNSIVLGSGNDVVTTSGTASILAGSGHATITALGNGPDVVTLGSGSLTFIGGAGAVTIFRGSGSDTFTGGTGNAQVYGGTAGHNLLVAGTGLTTLFGGRRWRPTLCQRVRKSIFAGRRGQRDTVRCLRHREGHVPGRLRQGSDHRWEGQ